MVIISVIAFPANDFLNFRDFTSQIVLIVFFVILDTVHRLINGHNVKIEVDTESMSQAVEKIQKGFVKCRYSFIFGALRNNRSLYFSR